MAEDAGDPRAGTASPARQWFLVEHPGPWGVRGHLDSRLDPTAVAALSRWAGATGGRVLLVRRPGRGPAPARRTWLRVDSRPGLEAVHTGTFGDERELVGAVDDPGRASTDPVCLVCAHGRHDTCCAVRGRPLAAALAAADPGAVWECSHVGGCRFAPAQVLLPHGFMLGGVPVSDAPAVWTAYRAGTVEPRWLRGRTSLPTHVQAAQHTARLHTGATGVDALGPAGVETLPDGWRVTFTDPACSVEVRERVVPAGRPLTCAATAPGRLRTFETGPVVLRH